MEIKLQKKGLTFTLFISLLFWLTACGGDSSDFADENIQAEENGAFVAAKQITINDPIVGIYEDVKGYKISYITTHPKTDVKIQASGLLLIPQKDAGKVSPLLSYQHATNFLDENVPSNNPSALVELAGRGFIVTAPDYIGYGDSASQSHTYIYGPGYVNAGIDMIRATKTYLKSQNIVINDQLFLAGYSEGGYATLAMHKAIQESGEFTITATAAGAGPYDLIETAKIVANKDVNENPAFMSFVLKTYDDVHSLNAVSEMYQTDYIDAINTVFDGTTSGGQIKLSLTTITSSLFTSQFLATLRGEQSAGSFEIMDKLEEQSIYNWTPNAPTMLFHSKDDETVPYENTQKAYATMIDNGASITLKTCEIPLLGEFLGDTHVTCAPKFILNTAEYFLDYDPELK